MQADDDSARASLAPSEPGRTSHSSLLGRSSSCSTLPLQPVAVSQPMSIVQPLLEDDAEDVLGTSVGSNMSSSSFRRAVPFLLPTGGTSRDEDELLDSENDVDAPASNESPRFNMPHRSSSNASKKGHHNSHAAFSPRTPFDLDLELEAEVFSPASIGNKHRQRVHPAVHPRQYNAEDLFDPVLSSSHPESDFRPRSRCIELNASQRSISESSVSLNRSFDNTVNTSFDDNRMTRPSAAIEAEMTVERTRGRTLPTQVTAENAHMLPLAMQLGRSRINSQQREDESPLRKGSKASLASSRGSLEFRRSTTLN